MAEGDALVYNEFKFRLLNGSFNLANAADTIKVALLTGHTPDIDTHTTYASVSGDEVSDSSYTAGGNTLAGQATSKDNTNDYGVFDGTDLTFTSLDVGTPSDAVMYDDTASDYLMIIWELATASNGGNYTLQWASSPTDAIAYIS